MRASDSSFQVRWLERTFENGALKDTKRFTGLLSIVITPPRTAELVRKNPLGIYVHAFNWSQDLNRGRANEHAPRLLSASTVVVALGACATACWCRKSILDSPAFKAAKREPEPKPPVEYRRGAEAAAAARPAQARPEGGARKRRTSSRRRSASARQRRRRIEPAKDGYINAIQVYPYTKGALYQLYAAVNQVTDIALEPGEKLVSVSAGDTVRWVVGDTTSGEGKDAKSTSW